MTPEVEDALQNGATVSRKFGTTWVKREGTAAASEAAVAKLRSQMYATLQELPDGMTVKELREELEYTD